MTYISCPEQVEKEGMLKEVEDGVHRFGPDNYIFCV